MVVPLAVSPAEVQHPHFCPYFWISNLDLLLESSFGLELNLFFLFLSLADPTHHYDRSSSISITITSLSQFFFSILYSFSRKKNAISIRVMKEPPFLLNPCLPNYFHKSSYTYKHCTKTFDPHVPFFSTWTNPNFSHYVHPCTATATWLDHFELKLCHNSHLSKLPHLAKG